MAYARSNLGYDFYIEENAPVSLLQANFTLESQAYEKEVNQLSIKNKELSDELSKKIDEIDKLRIQIEERQTELEQLKHEASENSLRLEKFRRNGIPYCNRSFSCLHVRLKMPQFTCITLQPLFEACPELEVIIADMARKLFYKKMIQLQQFLLLCHMGAPSHIFKGLMIN